ncbi:MAG: Uncharacterised protein [Gammaproteobacteria bacterium]|nr:MAG: Uncharacterised protein [Gammaproteobacteria bacterium]
MLEVNVTNGQIIEPSPTLTISIIQELLDIIE